MGSEYEDLDTDESKAATVIVKDTRAAERMRRVQAKEAQARYSAIVERERLSAKAAERARASEVKLEIAKLRMNLSAGEKARAHLAVAGPLYLLLLVGSFLILLAFGTIPQDQISVASVLLTTLVTMIGGNLRSIVAEGAPEENGHDQSKKPAPKKPAAGTK